MAAASLIFDTKIDSTGMQKGLQNINQQTTTATKSFKNLGIAIAAAFAVKKAFDFGKQAVGFASDLQEVQNVVDTAFADMAYKMEDFADTSIKSFGISELAAKQTGSTFMAMAKGMQIASGEASDMALALTGLSADMSSFYNVSQDISSTALKSIFTGETETLKQFGIVMTEANLSAFAMSKGITKSIKDMSQAEKVQLRYAFVMQQTAMVQGDFAKTSDSWANQTRILTEQWKAFLSVIGTGLLRVLTPAIKTLNSFMSTLLGVTSSTSDNVEGVFSNPVSNSSLKATENLTKAQEDLYSATSKNLGGFDELNSLDNSKGVSGASAISDFEDTGDAIKNAGKQSETAGKKTNKVFEGLKDVLGEIGDIYKKVFKPIFDTLKESLSDVISAVTEGLSFAKSILVFITPVLQCIAGLIGNFMLLGIKNLIDTIKLIGNVLKGISKFITGVFTGDWEKAWGGIKDIVKAVVGWFKDTIININEFLIGRLAPVADFFSGVWERIKEVFSNVGEFFSNVFNNAWSNTKKVFAPVGEFFSGVWADIKKPFSKVGEYFSNMWDGIKTKTKRTWDEICGFFSKGGKIFEGFTDGVGDLFKKIVNGLITGINTVISAPLNKINGMLEDFREISILGAKPFSNLGTIPVPQIPKLATGTVVPANYGEFTAILGDNKREPEIVSPLSTMKQALKEALTENGGGSSQPVTIVLKVGVQELAKVCIDGINELTRSTGVCELDLI